MSVNLFTIALSIHKYWIGSTLEFDRSRKHFSIGKTERWDWQLHVCLFNIVLGICFKNMEKNNG